MTYSKPVATTRRLSGLMTKLSRELCTCDEKDETLPPCKIC